MTFVEILRVLRLYGADVLLLALGVGFAAAALKKFVLREGCGKLYPLAPFILGPIFFAVYRMIATWSLSPLTKDIFDTLEGGFSCGCAATLYFVVYDSFVRGGKQTANPIAEMLKNVVPEEVREEVADRLLAESASLEGDELKDFVRETLHAAAPDLAPTELEIHVCLIADALASFGR